MPKYKVTIIEELYHDLWIEAKDDDEALEIGYEDLNALPKNELAEKYDYNVDAMYSGNHYVEELDND